MDQQTTLHQLISPGAAQQLLNVGEEHLVALVNNAELGAYDLAGAIRFKQREVEALLTQAGCPRTGGR